MVVFGGLEEESTQDHYLDQWTDLAGDEIRRGILSDACVLMAQVDLKQRVKTSGCQELELLEMWWKSKKMPGDKFFDTIIKTGFKSLEQVRCGRLYTDLSGDNLPVDAHSGLCFLRDIAKVTTAKEIEMATLHVVRCASDVGSEYFMEDLLVLIFLSSLSLRLMSANHTHVLRHTTTHKSCTHARIETCAHVHVRQTHILSSSLPLCPSLFAPPTPASFSPINRYYRG